MFHAIPRSLCDSPTEECCEMNGVRITRITKTFHPVKSKWIGFRQIRTEQYRMSCVENYICSNNIESRTVKLIDLLLRSSCSGLFLFLSAHGN